MLTPHLLKPRSQINAQRLPPGCQHSLGPSLCPPWVTAEMGRGTWGTARALCLLFLQVSHRDKATESGLGASWGRAGTLFTPCPGDFPSGGPGGAQRGHLRGLSLSTPEAKKPHSAGVLLLISPSSAPHPAAVSIWGHAGTGRLPLMRLRAGRGWSSALQVGSLTEAAV